MVLKIINLKINSKFDKRRVLEIFTNASEGFYEG